MTGKIFNYEKAEDVAGMLKLLANPNRLMIVCRLLDGEISVGDIETELGIRQPTLSRELGRLRDEGIIAGRRQSKVVFYSLVDSQMRRMIRAVCAAAQGEPLLAADAPATPSPQPEFLARPKFAPQMTGWDPLQG